jgi:hypothetical protein
LPKLLLLEFSDTCSLAIPGSRSAGTTFAAVLSISETTRLLRGSLESRPKWLSLLTQDTGAAAPPTKKSAQDSHLTRAARTVGTLSEGFDESLVRRFEIS